MDTLLDRIRAAYPAANPLIDFTVVDAGYGAYLASWNINGPLPEGVMMGQTAIQVFAELHSTLRRDAQALIRKVDSIQDLLNANTQVAELAYAADAGAVVGNTGMVREEMLMGLALIASFRAYVGTEVAAGITVRDAVNRLG